MTITLKFTTVNDSQNKNTEYHLRIKILKNITVTKSTAKFFNWYLSYIWIDNLPGHFLFCLVHCISKWLGCKCVYFDRVRQTTDYYFTPLLDLKNLRIYLPTSCYQSPVLPLSIIKANFYGAVLKVHFTPLFHISYIFTAGHSIKLTRVKALEQMTVTWWLVNLQYATTNWTKVFIVRIHNRLHILWIPTMQSLYISRFIISPKPSI